MTDTMSNGTDTSVAEMVDLYLAAWNETDATARKQLITRLWAEDGVYTDPMASVSGIDAIDGVIAGAQQQFAGMRFAPGEVLEAHHNVARFTWELIPESGGEAVVVGFDVAAVDAQEKITSVYGFIDKMPGPIG